MHVCDIDRSALDRLAAELPGITGSMADASVATDVDAVFDDVRASLGGLDVLVGNAGIDGPVGAIEDIDGVGWERTIAVNLHSQFYFARRAVPLLKASRAAPCMIAMGSLAAPSGQGFRTPYASSKWGVVGLVTSLAVELRPHGIRVNAILPGTGEDEGVAALALFLCSPAARGLTGQAVNIEGDVGALRT